MWFKRSRLSITPYWFQLEGLNTGHRWTCNVSVFSMLHSRYVSSMRMEWLTLSSIQVRSSTNAVQYYVFHLSGTVNGTSIETIVKSGTIRHNVRAIRLFVTFITDTVRNTTLENDYCVCDNVKFLIDRSWAVNTISTWLDAPQSGDLYIQRFRGVIELSTYLLLLINLHIFSNRKIVDELCYLTPIFWQSIDLW